MAHCFVTNDSFAFSITLLTIFYITYSATCNLFFVIVCYTTISYNIKITYNSDKNKTQLDVQN